MTQQRRRRKRSRSPVQVAAAEEVAVHVGGVEAEEGLHQGLVHRVARPDLDAHPRARQLPQLAADLVAPLAPEARQVVLEVPVAFVAPVVLETHAGQVARPAQAPLLVGPAEVHVDARQVARPARVHQGPAEQHDPGPAGLPGEARSGEEAASGDRSEGHAHEQLRVVGEARAQGRVGPGPVEDELAFAVALHVQRAGRHRPAGLVARHQRSGQPARPAAHAARLLQGGQELPLQEGRLVAHQRVPRCGVDPNDPVLEADLRHRARV